MPTFKFDTTIIRNQDEPNEREIEVEVEYSCSPFVPAVLYGDCPQPAEGGEVEIVSVKAGGVEIETTRLEDDYLEQEAWERADADMSEYDDERIRDFS